jgi:hypothetical protein
MAAGRSADEMTKDSLKAIARRYLPTSSEVVAALSLATDEPRPAPSQQQHPDGAGKALKSGRENAAKAPVKA